MAYLVCPKCKHTPLPAEQAFPAACPGCGVIFAKLGEALARPRAVASRAAATEGSVADGAGANGGLVRGANEAMLEGTEDESFMARLRALMFYVPGEVARINWYGRIALLLLFTVWTYFIWRDMDIPAGDAGSYILHVILTPFHEAGHYLIFRWFGEFIMILGGTLGQHLFAIVLGGALLWQRRDPFGAAIFFWVLGFSVSDMGVYMYDAFDPKLMLLDGKTGADSDGHDWQNIFGILGLLKSARGIGVFFGGVGRVMMVMGLAWAAWMLWLQHARLSDSPFAEEEQK
jgi:hypothetical protein